MGSGKMHNSSFRDGETGAGDDVGLEGEGERGEMVSYSSIARLRGAFEHKRQTMVGVSFLGFQASVFAMVFSRIKK